MLPTLTFSVLMLAPAAPMPKDSTPNLSGPPPQVLYLGVPNRGNDANLPPAAAPAPAGAVSTIRLTTYTTKKVEVTRAVSKMVDGKRVIEREKKEIDQRVPTTKPLGERGETFTTVSGSKLTTVEAVRRFQSGAVALISQDGKPVEAGWLRVANKDVIVIHSAEITGPVAATLSRGLTTPAPRLERLVAEADGTIKLATVEVPSADGNMAIAGNGRVQIVIQGNIGANGAILPIPVNEAAPQAVTKPGEKKPLDKIAFEAYTASGDSVSREEALRRLKSGGIVLIANSNMKPDMVYLKAFAPELLVLVSAELVQRTSPSGSTAPGGLQLIPAVARPIPIRVQVRPAPAPVPVPAPPEPDQAQPVPVQKAVPRNVQPISLPAVRPEEK